jgi:hypothetical protein
MAALTTHPVPLQGLRFDDLLVPATSGGDDCAGGAGVLLVVNNGSGSSITVTLAVPETVDGDLTVEDRAVSVVAGGMEMILVTDRYVDPATGRAAVTYSAVTTVTVGAFRVPTS